jgi:large subunit ribosomal protein L13
MIIDATDLIAGRIASVAAKKSLLGEEIKIVNCEKAVISGKRYAVLDAYEIKRERATIRRGPYTLRRSDKIMLRIIRGMLPHKKERGILALKRIICYVGVPSELSSQKLETIKEANVSKMPNINYVSLDEISKHLGAKQ